MQMAFDGQQKGRPERKEENEGEGRQSTNLSAMAHGSLLQVAPSVSAPLVSIRLTIDDAAAYSVSLSECMRACAARAAAVATVAANRRREEDHTHEKDEAEPEPEEEEATRRCRRRARGATRGTHAGRRLLATSVNQRAQSSPPRQLAARQPPAEPREDAASRYEFGGGRGWGRAASTTELEQALALDCRWPGFVHTRDVE